MVNEIVLKINEIGLKINEIGLRLNKRMIGQQKNTNWSTYLADIVLTHKELIYELRR